MKAREILIELNDLEKELKSTLAQHQTKNADKLGIKKQDVNGFVKGREVWSWGKILDIAVKMGL